MSDAARLADEELVAAIRAACSTLTDLCRAAVAAGLDVTIESEGEDAKINVRSFVSRHF